LTYYQGEDWEDTDTPTVSDLCQSNTHLDRNLGVQAGDGTYDRMRRVVLDAQGSTESTQRTSLIFLNRIVTQKHTWTDRNRPGLMGSAFSCARVCVLRDAEPLAEEICCKFPSRLYNIR